MRTHGMAIVKPLSVMNRGHETKKHRSGTSRMPLLLMGRNFSCKWTDQRRGADSTQGEMGVTGHWRNYTGE